MKLVDITVINVDQDNPPLNPGLVEEGPCKIVYSKGLEGREQGM